MKFYKTQEIECDFLECNDLNNDVLVRRMPDEIKDGMKVKIQKYQYAVLIENGKVIDACYEPGYYEIREETEADKKANLKDLKFQNPAIKYKKIKNVTSEDEFIEFENWEDYYDEKTSYLPLSLIFINLDEITDNKFYFKDPIEYEDWTNLKYDEIREKEFPEKTSFTGDGKFNFIIKNPSLFLSSILGIREHYTKQELIEQIRKTVVNSIILGINELGEEYKLSVQLIKHKTNELEIKVSQNDYDEKLAKRGIKITYFEISNFEEIEPEISHEKEDNIKENFLKKLFVQLYNVSKTPEFIEAENMTIKVNEKGEIETIKKSNVCLKCGSRIEEDDTYCTRCGAMLK
jgi:membrane protease subunit (stomatin/prohibitin family)